VKASISSPVKLKTLKLNQILWFTWTTVGQDYRNLDREAMGVYLEGNIHFYR